MLSLLVRLVQPTQVVRAKHPATGSWDDSYALANSTVAQMTIDEIIGIVKGTGQLSSTRKSRLSFQIRPAYMYAQAAAWATPLRYRVLGFRPFVSKTALLVCAW